MQVDASPCKFWNVHRLASRLDTDPLACIVFEHVQISMQVDVQAVQSRCVITVKKKFSQKLMKHLLYLVPCVVLSLLCKFGADRASCSSGSTSPYKNCLAFIFAAEDRFLGCFWPSMKLPTECSSAGVGGILYILMHLH